MFKFVDLPSRSVIKVTSFQTVLPLKDAPGYKATLFDLVPWLHLCKVGLLSQHLVLVCLIGIVYLVRSYVDVAIMEHFVDLGYLVDVCCPRARQIELIEPLVKLVLFSF